MQQIHQDIAKHSKTLILKEAFYGLFLLSISKELTTSIETACVAKENINSKLCINPEFWATLDDKTKVGVLKHEMLHLAFFHLIEFDRFSNKKLYNVAADLEINQYIQEEFKGPTWDGLEITNSPFKELKLESKKGTKYYYEKLEQEIKNNPEGDVSELVNGNDDIHKLWEDFKNLNESEKKLIQKQIDHQLKNVAENLNKNRGTIPSEMKDYINNLFIKEEAVIDWKSYLRRFNGTSYKIHTKKTRKKPNKRYSNNPALRIKLKKNTLVAIDTSGSVNIDELKEFFNEIYYIYKSGTQVTIVECDAVIQRVYEYDGELKNINVQGRGGTSFEPVMIYLKENSNKFQNLIYFTDGECVAPTTQPIKPMLWVHSSKSHTNMDLPGAKIKIK
jgi:predicted metal-dependent peptidase